MTKIGIGIPNEIVRKVMSELAIRENRQDDLLSFFRETTQNGDSEIDNLQRFIAFSTKANELCFLSFMQGLLIGAGSVTQQIGEELPGLIEKSARYGAAEALKGNLPPDMAETAASTGQTPTEPKKKTDDPQDIMYG